MFSQYEASILSKAYASEDSRQQIDLASAAHRAGTWILATAVILLAAYEPLRQGVSGELTQEVKPIGLAAQQTKFQLPEEIAANPPHVPHLFFGYVEFDWDPYAPGGVPGFETWPPKQPLTVVRAQQ